MYSESDLKKTYSTKNFVKKELLCYDIGIRKSNEKSNKYKNYNLKLSL